MAAVFLAFPFIYSSLYGRFLLLQVRMASGAGGSRVAGAVGAAIAILGRRLGSGGWGTRHRSSHSPPHPFTPTHLPMPAPCAPTQMDDAGNVVVINALFACFDLAARLGDRACDGLALKFLYGERGRDALTALRVRRLALRELRSAPACCMRRRGGVVHARAE